MQNCPTEDFILIPNVINIIKLVATSYIIINIINPAISESTKCCKEFVRKKTRLSPFGRFTDKYF